MFLTKNFSAIDIFRKFDKNQKGVISNEEFKKGLKLYFDILLSSNDTEIVISQVKDNDKKK